MKAIHAFFVLFFLGFTVGCASIYGVQHDFDKQFDFKSLKTYDWMSVPEKADIDSLNVERVKKAVNAELQAKGLMMTSDNPDFLIAEHLGKKDKVQITSWGYDYGPYDRYRGGYRGPAGISTHEYEEGLLILDFVENILEDFKKVIKPNLEFSKSVLSAHERIYQAICEKNLNKAHDEMYRHVEEVECQLIRLKSDIDLWQVCMKTGS